jgi:hypothetical protein
MQPFERSVINSTQKELHYMNRDSRVYKAPHGGLCFDSQMIGKGVSLTTMSIPPPEPTQFPVRFVPGIIPWGSSGQSLKLTTCRKHAA